MKRWTWLGAVLLFALLWGATGPLPPVNQYPATTPNYGQEAHR